MRSPRRKEGFALILFALVLIVGAAVAFTMALSTRATQIERERLTQKKLGDAKDALIAYATARPLTRTGANAPGYLPCPDLDDDGIAEVSCGSAAGDTGQSSRLGRLPWKTLGLPDVRDDAGERLWYAVSSAYKESTPLAALNPDTGLGTITVRDSAGALIYDGTNASFYTPRSGGVAAVIFAPGAVIDRWENAAGTVRTTQDRSCSGGTCNAAGTCVSGTPAKCNPRNYLDKASGITGDEDNADFVDRNDTRAGNTNGFIQGPVANAGGATLVNDRLAVITYDDIMQPMMQRVASEAYRCLLDYRNDIANVANRYPFPAPACRSGYPTSSQWSDREPILFGRVAWQIDSTRDIGPTMSDQWTSACSIVNGAASDHSSWFTNWRDHVFFAIASSRQPGSGAPGACNASTCLQIVDGGGSVIAQNKEFAVIVAGPPMNTVAPAQTRSVSGVSSSARDPRNYLERTNAALEGMNDIAYAANPILECLPPLYDLPPPGHPALCSPLSSCNKVSVAPRDSAGNDLVRYYPP